MDRPLGRVLRLAVSGGSVATGAALGTWMRAVLTRAMGQELVRLSSSFDYHPPDADFAFRLPADRVAEGVGLLGASGLCVEARTEAGFVNLRLHRSAAAMWKGVEKPLSSERVVVEHTSITPCYPINLATARSTVIGEQLRRCAAVLGATATARFWYEDRARQRQILRIDSRIERLSDFGKADHVVGAAYISALQALFGYGREWAGHSLRNMTAAHSAVRLVNTPSRSLDRRDDDAITEAYLHTLTRLGAREVAFDFESDLADEPVARQSDPRPRYMARNRIYFSHLLESHDRVLSVVPERQRHVVSIARDQLEDVLESSGRSLSIHFYGDVTSAGAVDSMREGRFHAADEHLYSTSTVRSFRTLVLSRNPSAPIEIQKARGRLPSYRVLPTASDPTVRTHLLLDELPDLAKRAMETARFARLMDWSTTVRRHIRDQPLDRPSLLELARLQSIVGE